MFVLLLLVKGRCVWIRGRVRITQGKIEIRTILCRCRKVPSHKLRIAVIPWQILVSLILVLMMLKKSFIILDLAKWMSTIGVLILPNILSRVLFKGISSSVGLVHLILGLESTFRNKRLRFLEFSRLKREIRAYLLDKVWLFRLLQLH